MMPLNFERDLARAVRGHGLGWLVAANLVGVGLALVLVWPGLGSWLGPLSYGRWVPVHLNAQLYGWCSLPLVGALMAACLVPRHPGALSHARLALAVWSLVLAGGAVTWLSGHTSGKLFLDWSGWSRVALGLAMCLLWTYLATHLWWGRERSSTGRWRVAATSVAVLLGVPVALFWSAGREVYPAVNPHSGGATGAALLGSTLGIVVVFGMLPILLGQARRWRTGWFWWALAASLLVFMVIDHGSVSHHDPVQILALGLLLCWIPGLWLYGRAWAWSAGSRPWLFAAGGWWALLLASGWVSFLPGVSESWKFTNALVAHAHLAMAGLVTAVNFVVLNELHPARPVGRLAVFWAWQTGAAVHVVLLLGLGLVEAERPTDLWTSVPCTQAVYLGRALAGAVMAGASVQAWREAMAEGTG